MQNPSAVAPVGVISKIGTQYQFHWSHAILAVGFLAASGAGTAVLFKVFDMNLCNIIATNSTDQISQHITSFCLFYVGFVHFPYASHTQYFTSCLIC